MTYIHTSGITLLGLLSSKKLASRMTAWVFLIGFVAPRTMPLSLFVLGAILFSLPGKLQSAPLTEEAHKKAQQLFEEIYGKEFEKANLSKDGSAKLVLAKKLVKAAEEIAPNGPAEAYVIREKALSLAAPTPAGYQLACDLLELLLPDAPAKIPLLTQLVDLKERLLRREKTPEAGKASEIVAQMRELANAHVAERDYSSASKILARAQTLVKTYLRMEADLLAELNAQISSVGARERMFAQVQVAEKILKDKPDDEAANTTIGLSKLLLEDNAAAAAAFLAKSDNPSFKRLAKELANAEPKHFDVAEAYRNAAEAKLEKEFKTALLSRALQHYKTVVENEPNHPEIARIRLIVSRLAETVGDAQKLTPGPANPSVDTVGASAAAMERLAEAKLKYREEIGKIDERVEAHFEKLISQAEEAKKPVEEIKAKHDLYNKLGLLPLDEALSKVGKEVTDNEKAIQSAFKRALDAAKREKKTELANQIETEWQEFQTPKSKEKSLVRVLPPQKEWKSLLKGNDLSGVWDLSESKSLWRLVKGELVAESVQQKGSTITAKGLVCEDVYLRMEVQHSKMGGANIFFGGQNLKLPFGRVVINGDGGIHAGTLIWFKDSSTNQTEAFGAIQPANKWFTLEVVVLGNSITTRVNGEHAAQIVNELKLTRNGPLNLRLQGEGATLRIRKFDVVPLLSSDLAKGKK